MAERIGLRETKRRRTREAISEAAIALFAAEGYDRVPVARIAAAAQISKPTLFAYFPSKEDLVLHRIADHEDESARVVRARPDGTAPMAALRTHYLGALDRRDPATGLNDSPEVLEYQRLLYGTPALAARLPAYLSRGEKALAEALAEAGAPPGPARTAAAQVTAVQRVLGEDTSARMLAGEAADAVAPDARRRAEDAFDLLEGGLSGLFTGG
ncbi:TetR family transcriptional regulator [Nocardiopsis sp. CNT-189]|uniref:TetR/AcrR family transcriptional regulator n=1 Tax=Nocardiopsis oceanisediminis TaxID=2816862 RepID=UPI003B302DD0